MRDKTKNLFKAADYYNSAIVPDDREFLEEDEKISEPIIKETKEPTILFKGKVIRKGKVIISVKDRNASIGVQK